MPPGGANLAGGGLTMMPTLFMTVLAGATAPAGWRKVRACLALVKCFHNEQLHGPRWRGPAWFRRASTPVPAGSASG